MRLVENEHENPRDNERIIEMSRKKGTRRRHKEVGAPAKRAVAIKAS